jgi:hypothetical protein
MALNVKTAIKKPGAMTAAAKAEGLSNDQYMAKHRHDTGHSGQMARFAYVLRGIRPKK